MLKSVNIRPVATLLTAGQGLGHLCTWFYPSLQGILHRLRNREAQRHMYDFSNHWQIDCLFNSLFILTTEKTHCITSLCERKPPMTDGFHSQRVSNAESGSMSWRLYDLLIYFDELASSTGITLHIHLFVHSSLAMIYLLLINDIIKTISAKSPNFCSNFNFWILVEFNHCKFTFV